MIEDHPEVDRLWKRSGAAAKRLQRLADQLSLAAENRSKYGAGNPQREQELWYAHSEALERVLQLGEELDKAAIEAGILPP